MQTIVSISTKGGMSFFYLLVAVGVALGIVVWRVMRYPSARREAYRTTEGFSQGVSILGGAVVTSVLIFAAFLIARPSKKGFFRVDANPSTVRLFFQKGHVDVPRNQIQDIDRVRLGRRAFRLRISLSSGRQFRSLGLRRRASIRLRDRLRQRLLGRIRR